MVDWLSERVDELVIRCMIRWMDIGELI